jgi:hypothetical protein
VLRTCKVSVADIAGVEHSTEVTAGSLYEAVAAALASLRKDDWVGEIGTGLTTVRVEVLHPPVTHEVKMKDSQAWLQRKSGSPADMVLRDKLLEMLSPLPSLNIGGKSNSSTEEVFRRSGLPPQTGLRRGSRRNPHRGHQKHTSQLSPAPVKIVVDTTIRRSWFEPMSTRTVSPVNCY